ncbi:MAG: naringenin-chalcone synthase [Chlamydiia bacterium]|nr:naringenin-chalcone synthase [Chlamydiia bacterium]
MIALSKFQSIRPSYETTQKETLDWLLDAHVQAEKTKGMRERELTQFRESLKERLWRVGCKPDRIAKRGHVLRDYLHRNWDQMEIYRLNHLPGGENLSVRAGYYGKHVEKVFEEYYTETTLPPSDLIHVSCTGYLSPSGAQKIVSKRRWNKQTTVTHAYHMGCYGAFPAIRMGLGFIKSGKSQVDIVHTELCSLHSNPSLHQTDQLVSQSLFADGFIKYTLSPTSQLPHFRLLRVHEEIIPDSVDSMTWNMADWGLQMSLLKEVPVLISRHLREYLKILCDSESTLSESLFAIHPGGPKILHYIQELLQLTDAQMAYSYEILNNYGNMSSATIPHIWARILTDPAVQENTKLISIAFGPGLSISGSIMEKICGS